MRARDFERAAEVDDRVDPAFEALRTELRAPPPATTRSPTAATGCPGSARSP